MARDELVGRVVCAPATAYGTRWARQTHGELYMKCTWRGVVKKKSDVPPWYEVKYKKQHVLSAIILAHELCSSKCDLTTAFSLFRCLFKCLFRCLFKCLFRCLFRCWLGVGLGNELGFTGTICITIPCGFNLTLHFIVRMHLFLPESYTLCTETSQIWRRIKGLRKCFLQMEFGCANLHACGHELSQMMCLPSSSLSRSLYTRPIKCAFLGV